MTDFIGNAPDLETFQAAAQATGFVEQVVDPETLEVIRTQIKTKGTWQGSRGSWFLNVVGQHFHPTGNTIEVEGPNGLIEVPEFVDSGGFWVRLRWNEGPLGGRLAQFIAALRANGITIYEQQMIADAMVWTADGATPAPAWLGDVGQIM